MENPAQTLQKLLDWLQMQAAQENQSCIINARIAIGPDEARVLNIEPVTTLATIQF